ncbi:MAG: hypothetical protein ABIJ12_10860 [bacterium]
MDNDILKLLMESMGEWTLSNAKDPRGTISILITETVKFRDKLKEETGTILTVEDTRIALDALQDYLVTNKLPKKLTSEQKALTQIWIDRLTLFNK